jgi:signal transduction histidine kinase
LVSIIAVVLVFGGINLYIANRFVLQTAREEMEDRGQLIIFLLKEQLVNQLIFGKYAEINFLLNKLRSSSPDVYYIVVYNHQKHIVGHTFENNVIPSYLAVPPQNEGLQLLHDDKRNIYIRQLSSSLLDGKLGYIVLGLNETNLFARGNRLTAILVGMIVCFLILGIFGAYVFALLITYPINQLVDAFQKFIPGKILPQPKIVANDELMLLAKGFTEMMERVSALDRESKETQIKMMETEKLASVGVLASGIAHEINNPIASIELCLYRLKKSANKNGREKEYIESMTEATQHMKTIVRNLLDYSHHTEFKPALTDLKEVIAFALRLVEFRLQKNNIELCVETPEAPCPIIAEKAQLVQVIVNCVINAIDAVERDGRIEIRLENNEKGYSLTISDNGSGIDPAILKKIFDPFFTTKGNAGTGLGLYVSYNIVKLHNGTIFVKSTVGKGTKVLISLPKGEY